MNGGSHSRHTYPFDKRMPRNYSKKYGRSAYPKLMATSSVQNRVMHQMQIRKQRQWNKKKLQEERNGA